MTNQTKNHHLMWRAGFGPAASQLEQLKEVTPEKLYQALKKASSKPPDFMNVADDYLKGLVMGVRDEKELQKELAGEKRRMIQQKQREGIRNLNFTWLGEMVQSNAQLREKMALFWHGHFASRNINVFFQQSLLDIIRQNALGSFRNLLHQVSKSAAMLNFLNANQNRKGHPNENFAREVMELFTLGRGHYTEKDIKEAARAFTGWGANIKGEFVFRRFQHDDDVKTLFGKTKNFTGEEVLDLLLEQKQTAYFIASKIYRYFVNEKEDAAKVQWLANRFYASDYSIEGLMDDIFQSDWFYDAKNIGTRIKSPVELLVGVQRMLPMEVENKDSLLLLQRALGQILFYPPNVAGWPGGKSWIDSSTLMLRLRLPQLLMDKDELNIRPKADDDQMMGKADGETMVSAAKARQAYGRMGRPIQAEINWNAYVKQFEQVKREDLIAALSATLFQLTSSKVASVIKGYADDSTRENYIKTVTIQLMSTPEYQLC